jgi:hypothetical protein
MSNLKKILEKNHKLTIEDLQEFQKTYDSRFVAQKGFTGSAKIEHTYAHMGKLLGRLAEYVHDLQETPESASDSDIKNKIIPDLLVYSAWLANELGINMEESYLTRMIGNLNRLYKDKIPAKELEALEDNLRIRFLK